MFKYDIWKKELIKKVEAIIKIRLEGLPKHKKPEENYMKAYHDQIAQNQW